MRIRRLLASATVLALVAIAYPAHAQLFAPCGDTYFRDSYERGIKSAFSNNANLRPGLNDEGCYQAGLSDGLRVKAAGDSSCGESFSRGRADGLKQAQRQSGRSCYVSGYDVGRADLNIGAREADASIVGDPCVQAYRKGQT